MTKRVAALLCLLLAAGVCLTGCAKSVNLEGMGFDELIALRDAVEARLPADAFDAELSENAIVLEIGKPRVVGENIFAGKWKIEAASKSIIRVRISRDGTEEDHVLDGRGYSDPSIREAHVVLNDGDTIRILSMENAVLTPDEE